MSRHPALFPDLSRDQAEQVLQDHGAAEGMFLLRKSSRGVNSVALTCSFGVSGLFVVCCVHVVVASPRKMSVRISLSHTHTPPHPSSYTHADIQDMFEHHIIDNNGGWTFDSQPIPAPDLDGVIMVSE